MISKIKAGTSLCTRKVINHCHISSKGISLNCKEHKISCDLVNCHMRARAGGDRSCEGR